MATCTDTDEPIQPAGTLDGLAQCASCYLEGRETPCSTWSHYLQEVRSTVRSLKPLKGAVIYQQP